MAPIDLAHVSIVLERFTRTDLGGTLANIESAVKGLTAANCAKTLAAAGVTSEVLSAAASLKRLAGQVNVAIHATGILLCLRHILEAGETIEYVSLGAGNTGREFDLETNRRIAEFKFIHWRGGAESIRQNQLFKDFYLLAESTSRKRKYLYVLGTETPLHFLKGGRKLDSVLSRNVKLLNDLQERHGSKYKKVCDYYLALRHLVAIEDIALGTGAGHRERGNRGRRRARMNFGAIVKDYTSRHRERARRELRYYIIQRSLQDAIREAALSRLPGGKRHSHQRRIPLHVLQAAERRLQAIAGQVQTAKSFAELHRLIERHIKLIRGIGDLAVYDIAHRIGIYLQHAPEAVHLHAGTREGARALNLGGRTLDVNEFPAGLRKLSAAEIACPYDLQSCVGIHETLAVKAADAIEMRALSKFYDFVRGF